MQDDDSRGAHAPIGMGSEAWSMEDIAERQDGDRPGDEVSVGLTAVVLSVLKEQPVVMLVRGTETADGLDASSRRSGLPAGRFLPPAQASLEAALRAIVGDATGCELGFVEQLLTDYWSGNSLEAQADGGRLPATGRSELYVSYLALMRAEATSIGRRALWRECYELLPWEDFRSGRPSVLQAAILPGLEAWTANPTSDQAAGEGVGAEAAMTVTERVAVAFGMGGRSWDDQRVVDRFDLLCEAGLLPEASVGDISPADLRLVAAGLGRLRAKVRDRPVVFELLPPEFTLFELQRTVEAVLGPTLHKQNFRRLVEGTGLVEPTGDIRNNTGGRPAKTFRFRREVLLERPAPGVHVRPGRAA